MNNKEQVFTYGIQPWAELRERKNVTVISKEKVRAAIPNKQGLQSHRIFTCWGFCVWVTGLFNGDTPHFYQQKLKEGHIVSVQRTIKQQKGHKAASSAGFFTNLMANVWILDVNESRGVILEWLQQEIKKQNGVRSDSVEKCWVWYLAFYFQQVWLCSVSLWFLHKEKKWSDILEDWNNSSTHIHTWMRSLWFYFYRRGFSIQSP